MDVESTAEYLGMLGVTDSEESVAALHEATEGWPAGIALACLAAASDGRRRVPTHLSGQQHQIADYFVEEVLSSLDDETREFMLRTSVVRRFSAELVNAMLDRKDGHEVITRLAATNSFVIPLDDEHHWFRYHHLFQDLLADRLDRRDEDARLALLRRAARWHAGHGTIDEAFDYSQRSGDMALAGQLMLSSWDRLASRGQMATLMMWIGHSTDEEIASDPSYSIIAGWVHTLTGELRRAEFFAAAAHATRSTPRRPTGRPRSPPRWRICVQPSVPRVWNGCWPTVASSTTRNSPGDRGGCSVAAERWAPLICCSATSMMPSLR